MNPSWDEWQAFHAVLLEGSLSGAARRLKLSQPTVRGRIEGLERRVGWVLFVRSAAGLAPTAEARAMARHVAAMHTASEAALREASGRAGAIAGTVRVSASDFIGTVVLPEMLGRLLQRHPGLLVEIAGTNAVVDVASQEADIAIRMAPPAGDGLIVRKVAVIAIGFYASRAYLARRGAPPSLEDLADHDFIGPDRSAADARMLEAFGALRPRIVLKTDSHPTHFAAVRAGVGIGVVQRPVADRDPDLVPVLPGIDFARLDTFLVSHKDLLRLPKVRAVFDFLAEAFREFAAPGAHFDRAPLVGPAGKP